MRIVDTLTTSVAADSSIRARTCGVRARSAHAIAERAATRVRRHLGPRAAVTAQNPGGPAAAGRRSAATHRPSIAPAPTPQMDLAERGAGLFLRGAR